MEVYLLNYKERAYTFLGDELKDEIKGVFSSIEKAKEHLKLLYKGDVSHFDIDKPIEHYDTYSHEVPFYGYYLIKAKLDEFLT